jgi:prephenate dehydrogenase
MNSSLSINQVAILGVGLIGGSFGLALKQKSGAVNIIGIGRDPDRLAQAVQKGAIDQATTDIVQGVSSADLIVLSSTIGHILEALPTVLSAARPGAVVTDVGSAKTAIVAASKNDNRFIGGHPMAGSEKTGVMAASATLFNSATWALTPTKVTGAKSLDAMLEVITAVGAIPLILSPEEHDEMVSVTSHLPHVIAASFMRFAAQSRALHLDLPRMTAGSFADMTRIAGASPSIWRDVCLSNRDAVLKSLELFEKEIAKIKTAISENDADSIESYFAGSEAAKRLWS